MFISLIQELDEKLIPIAKDSSLLGLSNGKMGFCIYFYISGELCKNIEYTKLGERLLENVYDNINKVSTIDVRNGLSGIGLGIHFLWKNQYISGNINHALSEIDDEIFKRLSYTKYIDQIDTSSLIQITYYLYTRVIYQKKRSESEHLLQELICQTLNNIYLRLDDTFFNSPLFYTIDYQLPQFLFILRKIYDLNFYSFRIMKLLEEISYKILSLLPLLYANQLYLLWGMLCVKQIVNMDIYQNRIKLLIHNINTDYLIAQEMRDKNIYYNDGLTSIYILLNAISRLNVKIRYDYKKLINKIETSGAWSLLANEPDYFRQNINLYDGYCGVALLLRMYYIKNKIKL